MPIRAAPSPCAAAPSTSPPQAPGRREPPTGRHRARLLLALLPGLLVLGASSWSCTMTRFNGHAMTTGAQGEGELGDVATPRSRQCPPAPASTMCEADRTWARDTESGACCAFDSACQVPAGWERLSGPECGD